MFNPDKPQESSYPLLDSFDDDDERAAERPDRAPAGQTRRNLLFAVLSCCVAFVLLVIGFASGTHFKTSSNASIPQGVPSSSACQDPTLRREWRSLGDQEKHDYIEAVKCLKTVPSQLDLNQTLYDDFPWVHIHFGEYSHDAAPFLAWHRYFIHTYERKLREECGYSGHLTYWDWTLDWENITTSPVWDTVTGFGGNGNASMGDPVFNAYCVTEGPFAGLEVPYYEHIYKPHCLLRGFDVNLTDFRGELKPEALDILLLSGDYESINLGLENGPHISIPKSINGDFSLHTAPFDPVFFLHHTQLDRMWWRWQQKDIEGRSTQYLGLAETDSTEQASLDNIMPMGGLASDIKVSEIMTTESELLCYRY